MNKKEFFQNNSEGVFTVYDFFRKWQESYTKSFEGLKQFNEKVLSSRISERKRELGDADFTSKDSANRILYVWEIQLDDGYMWIISGGNGRGTSYEFYRTGQQAELEKQIIEKIKFLYGL